MAGEDLIQAVKDGYEAFKSGDVDSAIALFADEIEWHNPGNSSISGTFRGKDDVLGHRAARARLPEVARRHLACLVGLL